MKLPAASLLGLTLATSTLHAQAPISTGAFVVRLGNDTISVERFIRTADKLEGDVVRRMPNTNVVHYAFGLAPDGSMTQAQITVRKADGTVIQSLSPAIGLNTFVALPDTYAPYELWLAQLRMQKKDSAVVTTVAPLGGPSGKMPVKMLARDSVRAWLYGFPMRMHVDGSGRLLGLDGRATTIKYDVTRVPTAEINAIAATFAERDAAGKPLGIASRRDTLRAQVGGATVWIDYGRPLTRGRDVFTRGVLGDTLWRTGANAATQFRTDKDLTIEGKRLKAGTYTIWTSASPDNKTYALLFNTQTGQWGTEHDPARDVLSVPLKAERAGSTEEFTISLDATSPVTMLTLSWGTLRLSARVDGTTP